MDWSPVEKAIGLETGEPFTITDVTSVGGGCINTAYRLGDEQREFFIKLNDAHLADMFDAESQGLKEMAETATIRVPRPVCRGVSGAQSWLVMEYIHFGHSDRHSQQRAGEQLAAMHQATSEAFGWSRDNTIGSTPQHNDWTQEWISFWAEQRLGFQLGLAARHGHGGKLQSNGERLIERLPHLIDHAPQPSLLHGDLWGGNIGYDTDSMPVIFDPAVYYGDREADLAMTELFGGFGSDFYAAYNATWPLDPGYQVRKTLYNLYHILNHLNLFGSGYRGQAESMIERLLAAT